MPFSKLGLSDKVLSAVTAAGYPAPTPIQEQAIPHVLARRDVLGETLQHPVRCPVSGRETAEMDADGAAAGERAEAALVERTRQQKEAANATEALERRFAQREQDLTERAQQIRELEGELKEEKEHAENLGQLANERREQMTKLKEQLEEAEEGFEIGDGHLAYAVFLMDNGRADEAGEHLDKAHEAFSAIGTRDRLARIEDLRTRLEPAGMGSVSTLA